MPISGILLLLSLRHLDAASLRDSVANADPWRLALAVLVLGLFYLTQAVRWRVIAGAPSALPVAKFLEWVVGSIAVNNVVPGRPGDLLRAEWLARGAGTPRARALGTVVVDRGLDVATLVVLLAVTYPTVQHPAWLRILGIAAALAAALLVTIATVANIHGRRAGGASMGRVRMMFSDLAHEVRLRLRGPSGFAAAVLSMAAWCLWALSAWLVASSIGIELTPFDAFFVTAVLNLGVAIPSSPGYIGTVQWLSISALGVLGVRHADAFAFSVLMHGAWFIPMTLAGAGIALRRMVPRLVRLLPDPSSGTNAA
jgi:glycosyltransferase 2 family protein